MRIIGIIAGILLALSGGYCFFHPVFTFGSLGWLIGLSSLVYGIGGICAWKAARARKAATAWELISAILAVIIGILIFVNLRVRLLTDVVLVIIIGGWLAVSGILRIWGAVKLKHTRWGISIVWGILLLLTALTSWIHPAIAALSLGWCLAFAMITQGVNLIILACLIKKNRRTDEKAAHS